MLTVGMKMRTKSVLAPFAPSVPQQWIDERRPNTDVTVVAKEPGYVDVFEVVQGDAKNLVRSIYYENELESRTQSLAPKVESGGSSGFGGPTRTKSWEKAPKEDNDDKLG